MYFFGNCAVKLGIFFMVVTVYVVIFYEKKKAGDPCFSFFRF